MKKTSEIFKRMSTILVDSSRLDMHIHTTWTDGKASMKEMLDRCSLNHLSMAAITDHIRSSSDYYGDYLKEIESHRDKYHFLLYGGFEAKISGSDGRIDIPKEAYDMADIIIASVHRVPYGGRLVYPRDIQQDELAQVEKDLSIAAVSNREGMYPNVLGHCGGMSIAAYGSFPIEYFDEVIRACNECDTAFEFNYKYHEKYEKELKELLKKYDPYVSVGSDAHEVNRVSNRSFV